MPDGCSAGNARQSFNEGKRQALDLVDNAEAAAQPCDNALAHPGVKAQQPVARIDCSAALQCGLSGSALLRG